MELHITGDGAYYIFSLKNSISQSVIDNNPTLLSTKFDGYGIKIIREIAEKYNGYSDFYEENGMFCCVVLLRKNI